MTSDSKVNSIIPCTLSMLSKVDAENDAIKMLSRQIDQIETIAKVKEMSETALKYEFKLFDSTHTLTGVFYKKTGVPSSKQLRDFEYTENCYVHIFGIFRKTQELTFVITKIQNIKSYLYIDEFLSRTVLSYILSCSPIFPGTISIEEDIINALKKAGKSAKGHTCSSIREMLSQKLPLNQIEENVHELIFKGLIKNGADWDHFLLSN